MGYRVLCIGLFLAVLGGVSAGVYFGKKTSGSLNRVVATEGSASGEATPSSAQDEEVPTAPDNFMKAIVISLVNRLPKLDGPVANSVEEQRDGKVLGSPSCISAYQKLYQKDALDIRLFLGYRNSEADPGVPATDQVSDDYSKAVFIEMLTKPCVENLFACGFNRDPNDADLLSKSVNGPDGKQRRATLRIESSSVSESNHENEHQLKPEQKVQSGKIEMDFLDALENADVVLYDGHARHGTGPGSKPLPKGSWAWLDAGIFKPSRREMLDALKNTKNPVPLVGIFGCYTDQYYREAIQKASPQTGVLVGGGEATDEESMASALATINSVLGLECQEDFEKSLAHTKLYGFFPASPQ